MLVGRGSDCGLKEKIVDTRLLKPALRFGSWHKLGFEVTFEAIFGEVHRAYAASFPDWRVLQTQLDNPGFQHSGFFSGSQKKQIPFDVSSLRLLQP